MPLEKSQTIALCMIVKDEAEVITRAFSSVRGFVDYYCICDTGSTDNTIQVIKDYWEEHGLKGEVHQRPWVNFAHNRQESFELGRGKCDYIMTLDADEVFAPVKDDNPLLDCVVETLPKFSGDCVEVFTIYGETNYTRAQFFKDGLDWKWVQPVHEVCICEDRQSIELLTDACVVPSPDGARASDPQRFLRDAFVFETYMIDNPEDGRGWFYLAQSYQNAGHPEKAIFPLEKCLEFSKWDEETYLTHLRLGRYKRDAGLSEAETLSHFVDAYNFRPHRAEAIYELLAHYRARDQFWAAILYGEKALTIPYPQRDRLFVETIVHDWQIKDELSIAYYWVGRYEESKKLCEDLLKKEIRTMPKGVRERIQQNLKFAEDKINENKKEN